MLAGIGGRTIFEAKHRLTCDEFASWMAYRQKRGPLHLIPHADSGFALLATMVNRATGGKAEMSDFMPYADTPTASIEDISKMIGAVPSG